MERRGDWLKVQADCTGDDDAEGGWALASSPHHVPFTTEWDPHAKGQSVTLEWAASVASMGSDGQSVRAAEPFPPTGKHYVSVRIDKPGCSTGTGLGGCYYIGVATGEQPMEGSRAFEGGAAHTWALGDNGTLRERGETVAFPGDAERERTRFGSGDVVGMLVDMDTRRITYYKNGRARKARPWLFFTSYTLPECVPPV